MWKDGIKKPCRKIDDFISFIDFAPTFLELADIKEEDSKMQAIEGESFTDIFYSKKSGQVNKNNDHVLIGKERHDVGRPDDQGYPIRGIRKGDYLLILNFENSRWPSGNPETGYLNCDGGATKSKILADRRKQKTTKYWDLCFGKRPEKELYCIFNDPDCNHNIIDDPKMKSISTALENQLI